MKEFLSQSSVERFENIFFKSASTSSSYQNDNAKNNIHFLK